MKLLLWLVLLGLNPKDAIKLELGGGVNRAGWEIPTVWIGTWIWGEITGGGVIRTIEWGWIIGRGGWTWTEGIGTGIETGKGGEGDEVGKGVIGCILWIGANTGPTIFVDSTAWELAEIIFVVGTSAELIASIIEDWLGWKDPALGLLIGARVNCLGALNTSWVTFGTITGVIMVFWFWDGVFCNINPLANNPLSKLKRDELGI